MFGISGSFKKTKGKSETDITKDTLTTQAGTQTGTETTKGFTDTTQSTAATGTSGTQTTGTQTGYGTGTSTTETRGTTLDEGILTAGSQGAISLINQVFGGGGNVDALGSQVQGLEPFDLDQFISGGMQSARNRETNLLDATINQIANRVGAGVDENSQVALLANQAQLDSRDRLAGVYSQLQGQGAQIQNERIGAVGGAVGAETGLLNAILQGLKGGATTGTAVGTEATTTGGTTAGTSATQTSETATGRTQTAQEQVLLNVIQSLLSGTEKVVGTEDTKTKGTAIGGGASAKF